MLIKIGKIIHWKNRVFTLTGLSLLILLVACSNSEMEDQLRQSLLTVESERDTAIAQQNELQKDLVAIEAKRDELHSSLDSAMEERDGLQIKLDYTIAERDSLQERFDSNTAERDRLQNELDIKIAEKDELQLRLDYVGAERDNTIAVNEDLNSKIANLQDVLERFRANHSLTLTALSKSDNRVQELLTKYDKEIRADLLAEANAEIERACSVAVERYSDTVESSIKWDISWSPVIARSELVSAVEKCAEPGRSNAADVATEIERACNLAVEQYDTPIASNVQWKRAWSTVMSQDEMIEAVEDCAEPQRSRSIQYRAEADTEIERACDVAVQRYKSPVESSVQWNDSWSQVTTREDLIDDVAQCAERGRANAVSVEAEIERACGAAIERYTTKVSSLIRWKSSWSSVMSQEELIKAVEDCAEPERSQAIERAEFLDSCTRISVDKILKNPDALRGDCVVLYGRIVQFDSNTGPCSFHADIARNRSTNWWDYDNRSTFGYKNNELSSALHGNCPELDNIDVEDFIKVWATVLGSFTYDTSIGGSNTVPSFRIQQVELVSKA